MGSALLSLSRSVQELMEENQSLKEDLDRVLSSSPTTSKITGACLGPGRGARGRGPGCGLEAAGEAGRVLLPGHPPGQRCPVSPACRAPSAVLDPGRAVEARAGEGGLAHGNSAGEGADKGAGGSRAHGREGPSGQWAQSPEWAWQCEAASKPSPWKRDLTEDTALKATQRAAGLHGGERSPRSCAEWRPRRKGGHQDRTQGPLGAAGGLARGPCGGRRWPRSTCV